MEKLKNKLIAISSALLITVPCGLVSCGPAEEALPELIAAYSFEDNPGYTTYNEGTGNYDKVNYVFSEEKASVLLKEPSLPLTKKGVKGNALYMDGFSVNVDNSDFYAPSTALSVSAWVAPRVFENLPNYGDNSDGRGQPRLTGVVNYGNIEMGQGFCFGYGRLGMWGIQLALYNYDTARSEVVCFYDPINALPLYEWSHIAASFDGDTGYIALFYNGEKAYEDIIPELCGCEIVENMDTLHIGSYCAPHIEMGVSRQMVAGLLDEVRIYGVSLTPARVKSLYKDCAVGGHPSLDYSEVALDSSVYEGDRYRPQYHAIPPATWMNEPHSPFYYKGRYHVFYQCNPAGPYWSQIRWGHIVSDDMVHWKYVKDAVVPTAGICPEGVWTGGACIGPDGTPWLAITAGTNLYGNPNHGGQNVAFAHAADPNDPDLTDWIVEDKLTITQPNDNSQGEREQFRDPFVWYDDESGQYIMLVATSIPGRGGSANVYISQNMHEWEHKGYLYDCPYLEYNLAGEHWECVVLLPITTMDGSRTKYILFDCPQYARGEDAPPVECLYWVGEFNRNTYRFEPDDHQPRYFDIGTAIFTGQNGYCVRTDEEMAAGKTYKEGRSIIYAIAQGKEAGTAHNINSGWAHNFAFPIELHLADNLHDVIRTPIKEIESLYGNVLYEYSGAGKTADQINADIANVRGDTIKIDIDFTIDPTRTDYVAKLGVRYNLNTSLAGTERTYIDFSAGKVYIDRFTTTLMPMDKLKSTHDWDYGGERSFTMTVLLDRSMLEVYINGTVSGTMRVYPMYADSDYIRLIDEGAGINVTKLKITAMKSAYSADGSMTPPYYGNTGNLA